MQGRSFLLLMVLAFSGALMLGKHFFERSPSTDAAGKVAAIAADAQAVPVFVDSASANSEILKRVQDSVPLQQRMQQVNQDVEAVAGGVRNQNVRMNTFFNKEYSQGVLHAKPAGRGESVRWIPGTQELRDGFKRLHLYGEQAGAKGKVASFSGVDGYVYEETFDASALASGIYFYRIEAGAFRQTRQLILLK